LGARLSQEARQHADELEVQIAEQKKTIESLNAQIHSLGEAKQEHENALLQKFSELLNSKKLKIRDQQRLLSTAKVDAEAGELSDAFMNLTEPNSRVPVERVEGSRTQTKKPRAAEPSRASKRKAVARAPESSEDESSDGFEDIPKQDEEVVTPEQTDDETEDEDGGSPVREPTPPPPKKGLRKAIGGKGKAAAAPLGDPTPKESGIAVRGKDKEVDIDDIPPMRELPFKRKAAQAASQKIAEEAPKRKVASQSVPVDEDDSDDEL
jgi:uncharacterized coiled-coil protein SlyX